MMSEVILTEVASPPDREKLVIQFMIGREQFAELNQEDTELELVFYPRRDGQPWVFKYGELMTAMETAMAKLILP
jgi:phage pi2 protein 07